MSGFPVGLLYHAQPLDAKLGRFTASSASPSLTGQPLGKPRGNAAALVGVAPSPACPACPERSRGKRSRGKRSRGICGLAVGNKSGRWQPVRRYSQSIFDETLDISSHRLFEILDSRSASGALRHATPQSWTKSYIPRLAALFDNHRIFHNGVSFQVIHEEHEGTPSFTPVNMITGGARPSPRPWAVRRESCHFAGDKRNTHAEFRGRDRS